MVIKLDSPYRHLDEHHRSAAPPSRWAASWPERRRSDSHIYRELTRNIIEWRVQSALDTRIQRIYLSSPKRNLIPLTDDLNSPRDIISIESALNFMTVGYKKVKLWYKYYDTFICLWGWKVNTAAIRRYRKMRFAHAALVALQLRPR